MMISDLPRIMLYCLACTIIIECVFAFILNIRRARDFIIILLANVMTNPVLVSVTFVVRLMSNNLVYYTVLVLFELCVVVIESIVYKHTVSWRYSPFLLSCFLNAASFFIGEILNRIVF